MYTRTEAKTQFELSDQGRFGVVQFSVVMVSVVVVVVVGVASSSSSSSKNCHEVLRVSGSPRRAPERDRKVWTR